MIDTRHSQGWDRVRFGDVVRQVKDRVDPETAGVDRYVAGEHMDSDNLQIRRWGTVGDGYLGPAFHMRFRPGQVLYGSRRTYLRKVAVAEFEGICANTTFVMEPADERLLPGFLPVVMTTERFHEHAIRQSKGSVNPYINFSDLVWYEFDLPSVGEQSEIVGLSASIDDTRRGYEGVRRASRELFVAVFGELTHQCEGASLGDVASVTLGRQRAPKYADGLEQCVYLRAANVKDGRFHLDEVFSMRFDEKERTRYRLQPGDVLVTEGCGSLDEIGANAVWDGQIEGDVCFQNTLLRLRSTSDRLLQPFLAAWARFAFASGAFAGIASGTSIYHLGAKRTSAMLIPLPGIEVQRATVEAASRAERVGVDAEAAFRSLSSVRRSLLDSLVEGLE